MDDFFNPPTDSSSSDPTADFLARERAALGESFGDATTTGAAASSSGKDYERSASAFPDLDAPGAQHDEDDDEDDLDFLGGASSAPVRVGVGAPTSNGTGAVSVTNHTELAAFEQDYPEIELPSQQSNGFNSSSNNDNRFHSSQPPSTPAFQPGTAAPAPASEQDSEFIQSWRVKQKEEIARREEASKAKREETIVKAQHAIDNFYKEYNQKKEKNIAANKCVGRTPAFVCDRARNLTPSCFENRDEEAAFNAAQTDALAKGTTWERVCALVDLNDSRSKTSTKSKNDLTRFKEVLLSLKREGENAPGAAGY
ncbi:BZ3500_MvSof-1268-A1-R1_Chr5-2g08023 [Microbotryum saponariae]|uniref:Clathrin light chain n=1 Tax=Microbotryum saponariae TaxID=289078 RepID=A0A2X0MLG6_9BASI|nr:BZ3500_MvSof-1268-A1-R1_Chr5-2g08023 [Microbotryum saponariae]SDA05892.1 BZ3501_MvSof-1269-A2-R1_Chr5-2g07845 [Microbotryum saponariae]